MNRSFFSRLTFPNIMIKIKEQITYWTSSLILYCKKKNKKNVLIRKQYYHILKACYEIVHWIQKQLWNVNFNLSDKNKYLEFKNLSALKIVFMFIGSLCTRLYSFLLNLSVLDWIHVNLSVLDCIHFYWIFLI